MLKLKPTSYIYLNQICPAERQEQQNAVWNCDDPGEELSASQTDKLVAPVKCTAADCLPSWVFFKTSAQDCFWFMPVPRQTQIGKQYLRQSDLWGSREQEKKRWLNCLACKCFMAAQEAIKQRVISRNTLRFPFSKSLSSWHRHICWFMGMILKGWSLNRAGWESRGAAGGLT